MAYINGEVILPGELLQEIQKYFSGGMIYIPGESGKRKTWGTKTTTKSILKERNEMIKSKKKQGASIYELMEEFHLSYDTIKTIVYRS